TDLNFAGDVKGYIKNSSSGFDGKSDVKLDNFSYKDTIFAIHNGKAEFVHHNEYSRYANNPKGSFNSFSSLIDFRAERMQVSGARYDSIVAVLDLKDGMQGVNIFGRQDTTINANIVGKIDLAQDSVYFDINSLNFYYKKFNIKNSEPIHIVYNPADEERTIDFDKFTLASSIINVDLKGRYSFSGNSDFAAELTNVDIPTLLQYIYNPQSVYAVKESEKFKTPLKGKIRRLSVYYKGTFGNPSLSAEMNTGTIRYEQVQVGRIDAFIDYLNQNLSTDVLVSNAQGQGSLRLTGDIPFSNPLTTPDSAQYADMLVKPLNLKL